MVSDRGGRDLLRVLRSVPAMSVEHAASSVAAPSPQPVAPWLALRRRGRCADMAARLATASGDNANSAAAAFRHPALAPPDRRLLAHNTQSGLGALMKGTTAWAGARDWTASTRRSMVVSASDRGLRGRVCQQMLSGCPVVPAAMLWAFIDARSFEVRTAAARHSNCDAAMMRLGACSDAAEVRLATAKNPSCPVDVLGLLSSDSFFDVRWEVAQHASCDADTLNKMSYDSVPEVRELVALHERCAAETLRRLATDPFERARVAAAANLACGVDALELLSGDDQSAPGGRHL